MGSAPIAAVGAPTDVSPADVRVETPTAEAGAEVFASAVCGAPDPVSGTATSLAESVGSLPNPSCNATATGADDGARGAMVMSPAMIAMPASTSPAGIRKRGIEVLFM